MFIPIYVSKFMHALILKFFLRERKMRIFVDFNDCCISNVRRTKVSSHHAKVMDTLL